MKECNLSGNSLHVIVVCLPFSETVNAICIISNNDRKSAIKGAR